MSQENVELVRSAIEVYVAGDRDAYVDFMAKDVEICPDAGIPEAKPFRGREEFRRYLAVQDEGWEEGGRAELKEIFPVGDRVVARVDWGGKGRASGIDLRTSLTAITTVRDGQITKVEFFSTTRRPSKPPGCGSSADAQEAVSHSCRGDHSRPWIVWRKRQRWRS